MSNTRRIKPAAALTAQARALFADDIPEVGQAAGLCVAMIAAAAAGELATLTGLAEMHQNRPVVLGVAAMPSWCV